MHLFENQYAVNTNSGWYNNRTGLLYADNCLVGAKSALSGEITVEEGTRLIASGVFSSKTTITKINLPNTVKFIGKGVFQGCTGLNSINLPNEIEVIGASAFSSCSSLQEITLPTSLKEIPTQMMMGCKTLTNLYIPSSVKSIGSMAFYNCTGLIKITIAGTLNNVGSSAFSGCSNITELVYEEGVESTIYTGLTNLTSVSLPTSLKKIGRSSFSGCSKLNTIQIPENVIAVESYAFNGCVGLEEVIIPNNVDSIYDCAFQNCSKVTNLKLGKSVTYLGSSAFENCLGLIDLTIPKSIKEGSIYAFMGCNNIQTLTYEEGTNILIGVGATSASRVSIPESATIIGAWAFSGYSKLESIQLPSALKEIAHNAFSGCSKIGEIKLPSTVQKIGNYAFNGCSALSKVEISDIDAWAGIQFDGSAANPLYYAKSLYLNETPITDIKLSSNVKSIGDYAFYGMSGLESLEIPSSVNSIGKYFVSGCTNLKSLKVWWDNPVAVTIDNYTFSGVTPSSITLTVSRGTKSNYTSASYWNLFKIEETTSNIKRVDKDGNTYEMVLSIYDADAENDRITLVDGDQKIIVFSNIDLSEISYTRNFTNTKWQSLYVPFTMRYEDWKDEYDVAYINSVRQYDNDNDGVIDETIMDVLQITGGELYPNMPYMIRAKSTGSKTITLNNAILYQTEVNSVSCSTILSEFTFTGTYTTIDAATMLSNNYYAMGGGGLIKTNGTSSLKPFRWYMGITSRSPIYNAETDSPARISINVIGEDCDGETSIYEIAREEECDEDLIFNLNGQKLDASESLKPGLYIKNGKKIMIK